MSRRAVLQATLNLAAFAGVLATITRLSAEYRLADVSRALVEVPVWALMAGLGLTMVGYGALVGYDYLAFRFVGRPLPWTRMLVPSFVTWAAGNSAPASVLTGGGLRYRLYADLGLTAGDAAVIAGFNAVTYTLGLAALGGLALLTRPAIGAGALDAIALPARALGALLLAAVAGYLGASAARRKPAVLLRRRVRFPTLSLALAQLGVSTLDWLLSSGALFVLVAPLARISYGAFLLAFLLAQVATQLFFVPAGLGVFEAVLIAIRPAGVSGTALLASLLAYRVIYYLIPLLAAAAVLATRAALRESSRAGSRRWLGWVDRVPSLGPHLVAFVTFVSGSLLLVTGVIPTDQRRTGWLTALLPVSVIETSHFLASVVGAALLVLAWGLEARVRIAYRLAQFLFSAGILLTLLRSFDLRLAVLLGAVLVLLHLMAGEFPHQVSLGREPVSTGWRLAIGAVLLATLWIAVFASRHPEYAGEVWWRFALSRSGPALLRVMVAAGVTLMLFGLGRWFARRAPVSRQPR